MTNFTFFHSFLCNLYLKKNQRIQCGSNPVPLDYASNTLPLSHPGPVCIKEKLLITSTYGHISIVVCSFFEFEMVSKCFFWEQIKIVPKGHGKLDCIRPVAYDCYETADKTASEFILLQHSSVGSATDLEVAFSITGAANSLSKY